MLLPHSSSSKGLWGWGEGPSWDVIPACPALPKQPGLFLCPAELQAVQLSQSVPAPAWHGQGPCLWARLLPWQVPVRSGLIWDTVSRVPD